MVPVAPQAPDAVPYPEGTQINQNRIDLPGGGRRVWLEAQQGGWGTIWAVVCDSGPLQGEICEDFNDCQGFQCGQWGRLRIWDVIIDPGSFTNGVGADLRLPEVTCVPPSIASCINELGEGNGNYCDEGICTPAFIQHRPDRLPMDITACNLNDSYGLHCAGDQIISPPIIDNGMDYYGGTYVIDVPVNARGTYVVDYSNEIIPFFVIQDGYNYLLYDAVPAVINVCHPSVCAEPRNRFLSILPPVGPGGAPGEFAVRIKLLNLPQFPGFNGQVRWAAPPAEDTDDPVAGTTFTASSIGCAPYFQDWSEIGVLNLFGPEVVPGSTYEFRFGDSDCVASGDESCLSEPVLITTAKWGDVAALFGGSAQPNFGDITAVVDKFSGRPGAISAVRAKLDGNAVDPASAVDFQDISAAVSAFRGLPYPHAGPTACPAL